MKNKYSAFNILKGIVVIISLAPIAYLATTLLLQALEIIPKTSKFPSWILISAGMGAIMNILAHFLPNFLNEENQQRFEFKWWEYSAIFVGAIGLFAAVFGIMTFEGLHPVGVTIYTGLFIFVMILLGRQYLELTGQVKPRSFAREIKENRLSWDIIHTSHLVLLALTLEQLTTMLDKRSALEKRFGLTFTPNLLTEHLLHLFDSRLDELEALPESDKGWLTCWLIIPKKKAAFAGLIYFNGIPDTNGRVELSYKLSSAYPESEFITEVLQAILDWAFRHLFCKVVTVTNVEDSMSRRLLEKLGARLVAEDDKSPSWEFTR
jgi:RimJ/RimL family protein N-acetyltransferase